MSPAILTYLTTALRVLGFIVGNASPALSIILEITTALEKFHSESRDPTEEEWANINARIVLALDALDQASKPLPVTEAQVQTPPVAAFRPSIPPDAPEPEVVPEPPPAA